VPKTKKQRSAELGTARLNDQLLAQATKSQKLLWLLACSSLKRPFISSVKNVTGSNPFSPKIPNFDLPNTQTRPKSCLQVYEHNKALKVTQNLKSKHHFIIIQQSNKFHQNLQQQSNFHHQSKNMNTQCINSSTTHPITTTTTTTFNHEFIHNLTTTTSFFINFVETPNILMYIQFKHANSTSTTQLSFNSYT